MNYRIRHRDLITFVFALVSSAIVTLGLSGCVNNNDSGTAVAASSTTYDYPPLKINPTISYILPNTKVRLYGEGGSGGYSFFVASGLGTVDATGNYTASATPGTAVVGVSDSQHVKSYATVIVLNPLVLSPADTFVTVGEQKQYSASGGLPPYKYSILDVGKGTVNVNTGLLTAPATVGVTLLQVQDAAGFRASTTVKYLQPLAITPMDGLFPSDRTLQLVRGGGEGNLTYTFLQGAGLVTIDPNTNLITPNTGVTGRVVLKARDQVGYEVVLTLDFFSPRNIAMGKRHACAVNVDGKLYCWGANDHGQIADVVNGPMVGDDPAEMGDALKRITMFSNVYSITTFLDDTCILHQTPPLSNRVIQCWGAKDFSGSTYNPRVWSEQNNPLGSTTAPTTSNNRFVTYWGDMANRFLPNSDLTWGDGGMLGYWAARSSIGDTAAHTLNQATQWNNTSYGSTILSLTSHKTGTGLCTITTTGKVRCYGTDFAGQGAGGPLAGYAYGGSFFDESSAGVASLGSYVLNSNADFSDGGFLTAFGKVNKFSFMASGYGFCYVLDLNTTGWKTTPVDYQTLYAGKKRILCYGPTGGSGGDNIQAIADPTTNNYNHYSLYNGADSYLVSNHPHPELANIFGTSNANSSAEQDALDVASAINNGRNTACGLFDDTANSGGNIVKCWGNNANGLLGTGNAAGSPYNRTAPPYPNVTFPAGQNPVALYSTGDSVMCAKTFYSVDSMPHLFCWGNNQRGQIGVNSSTSYFSSPQEVQLGIYISAGYSIGEVKTSVSRICAQMVHSVITQKILLCWGDNNSGSLGLSSVVSGLNNDPAMTPFVKSPQRVSLGTTFSVKTFDIGQDHACAVGDDDSIKCWGGRYLGALGAYTAPLVGDEGSEVGTALHQVPLVAGRVAKAVYAGYIHNCVILAGNEDGQVMCFGGNGDAQLGRSDSPPYVDIGDHHLEAVDNVVTLDRTYLNAQAQTGAKVIKMAGMYSTFALTDSGHVFSWGSNSRGALGTGSGAGAVSSPTKLAVSNVKDISAGNAFACLVLGNATGDVHCWGWNNNGNNHKLGNVTAGTVSRVDLATPANTKVNLGTFKAVGISSGLEHACALSDQGRVKCWGDNSRGQLGIGVTPNYGGVGGNGPVPLNSNSEMGDNLLTINLGTDGGGVPLKAKQIVSGDRHNCVIMEDNRIKCWGDNSFGQLGLQQTSTVGDVNGQMGNSLGYVDLGPGVSVLSLTAGGNATCAVLSNNDIKCWGDNTVSQLGVGDKLPRGTTPFNSGTNLNKIIFPN